MNKKQLVTLWVGIALIILLILCQSETTQLAFTPGHFLRVIDILVGYEGIVVVALLTIGLICTFADKKEKKTKDE